MKSSVRVNISLPSSIVEDLNQLPRRPNVSKICAEALQQHLDYLGHAARRELMMWLWFG